MSKADAVCYVFNHMPRTAGGTLGEALARRFRVVPDYPGEEPHQLDHWLRHPLPLRNLASGDVLMGHYTAMGGRLHERYPEVFDSPRFRLITFLREPLDWVESMLRHFGLATLGVRNTDEALEHLAGTFARCYQPAPGQPTGESPLAAYWFVGLCEHVVADAPRLMQCIGAAAATSRLPSVNRSAPASTPRLDSAQRERYRRLAAPDFALFEWAARR